MAVIIGVLFGGMPFNAVAASAPTSWVAVDDTVASLSWTVASWYFRRWMEGLPCVSTALHSPVSGAGCKRPLIRIVAFVVSMHGVHTEPVWLRIATFNIDSSVR